MKKPLSLALSNTSLVASFLFAAPAVQGQAPTAVVMEEVTITAIREDRKSRGATGLGTGRHRAHEGGMLHRVGKALSVESAVEVVHPRMHHR